MATRNSNQSFEQFCARVEAEFGEPAVDVIRGMREQGQSWATIAGALECHENTLSKQWAWRGGWADQEKKYTNPWENSGKTIEGRAKAKGYDSLAQMLADYYMAGKTRADVARELGCTVGGLKSAVGVGLDLPRRPPTKAQLAASRANAARLNARRWGASSKPVTTQ